MVSTTILYGLSFTVTLTFKIGGLGELNNYMELVVSNLIQILGEIFDYVWLNVRRRVMLSLTGSQCRLGSDVMQVQLEGLSSTDENNDS